MDGGCRDSQSGTRHGVLVAGLCNGREVIRDDGVGYLGGASHRNRYLRLAACELNAGGRNASAMRPSRGVRRERTCHSCEVSCVMACARMRLKRLQASPNLLGQVCESGRCVSRRPASGCPAVRLPSAAEKRGSAIKFGATRPPPPRAFPAPPTIELQCLGDVKAELDELRGHAICGSSPALATT